MKCTNTEERKRLIDEFINTHTEIFDYNHKLINYINEILDNCPFEIDEREILEDNKYDIILTSIFMRTFDNLITKHGCLAYSDDEQIVIRLDALNIITYKLLDYSEDNKPVLHYTNLSGAYKKYRIKLLKYTKILFNKYWDLWESWIEEIKDTSLYDRCHKGGNIETTCK